MDEIRFIDTNFQFRDMIFLLEHFNKKLICIVINEQSSLITVRIKFFATMF